MKKIKDNRGLTLVELLITIAILSIVTVTATSFMVTGSKSFTKANADSDLQQEAELAVNQIEDIVIDTNGGITMEDNEDKAELTMYHAEKDNDATGAEVITYLKEVVVWDKSTDEIRYSQWNVTYDEASGQFVEEGVPTADKELLTDKVSKFEVDLDTDEETASDGTTTQIVRAVQIRVGYENTSGRVEYATSPIITLRNRMLLSANPEVIFEKPPTVDANFSLWYKGNGVEPDPATPIIDRASTVTRGESYTIYAYLDGSDKDISHLVNWEIEETNSLSTISSLGVLDVSENEANDFLTVVAKDKTNPRKTARGVLKVEGGSGKSFKAITITTQSLAPLNPKYSSYPTLQGQWTPEEIDAITYKWTVDHPDWVESFADTGKSLNLKVKDDPSLLGKLLEITLTAHSDVTGETRTDKITYRIDDSAFGGDAFMRRGMGITNGEFTGHGQANFWFDTDFGYDVECVGWEYYFCDEKGNRISAYDDLLTHVLVNCSPDTNHHFYYTLTYDDSLPLDHEYYVMVTAHMKDPRNGTEWAVDRMSYIPAVQLYDCYQAQDHGGANFGFYFGMVGYDDVWLGSNVSEANDLIGFSIEEFDYEAPAGVILTADFSGPWVDHKYCENGMYVKGTLFDGTNVGWLPQGIVPKYMKVKVYSKPYPSVYTYVSIYFNR